jgi:uncharacterized protein YecT (DUF1311 family)
MKPLTLIILALWSNWILADSWSECLEKSPGSQYSNFCDGEASAQLDKELDKKIKKLARWYLSDENTDSEPERRNEQKQILLLSQKHWRQYRDSWCDFQSSKVLGTGSAGMYSRCQIEFARQRMIEIEQ